jgi:hypothetical protein
MSNDKQYDDLKVLFFSCCLREATLQATANIPYRHKLKQQLNNFIATYNKEITPQLVSIYGVGDNDTHFEIINGMLEDVCAEFSRVRPDNYPVIVGLLRAYNEGKLFKQMEVAEDGNEDQNTK